MTVAARGDEGLLLARQGVYDLLLLDVMLPKKSGWDVLAGLRQSGHPCHVICLTARAPLAACVPTRSRPGWR